MHVLAILAAAVLFGSTGTAQALGPDAATPLGVGAVRIAIGAAGLWLFVRGGAHTSAIRREWRWVATGAVGVAAYQPGFFTGTERLGVALGTIVALGSGPAFAGVVQWGMGVRPTAAWARATGLAVAGGCLLVFAGESGARFSLVGLLGSLTAGLGYALYAIATRRLIERGVGSTQASAWQFSIGALLLAPLLFIEPMGWLTEPGGLLMALHLGLACTSLAYVLYGWGLRAVEAATATTLTLAEPVTAAILAVTVLDERLAWFGWVGASLVVLGLATLGGGARPAPWRGVSWRRGSGTARP
ncbi:MAG: EamA family transporter [Ilumatobacter fluminis]|uniref:DMT family transporter n=1 Tax=Ilumatobacter fluminis TaxID=467091 RepID=UPI0032EDD92F